MTVTQDDSDSLRKLRILLVLHKEYPYPSVPELLPIQVNKAIADIKLPIQGDDDGDNISNKNANYCELTAMYWAWKNLDKTEYVGLFHYRRYLLLEESRLCKTVKHLIKRMLKRKVQPPRIPKSEVHDITLLTKRLERTIRRLILKDRVVYLAYPNYLSGLSVREHYQKCHASDQWETVKKVFVAMHPDQAEMFESIERSSYLSPFNMFIASKTTFNEYCEWLFPILFELESKISIGKDQYQSRVFGFIAERLSNVYFKAIRTDLSIKYLESAFFDVKR